MVIYKADGYAACERALLHIKETLYDKNHISDVEFCAAFIAVCASDIHASNWICARTQISWAASPMCVQRCRLAQNSTENVYLMRKMCASASDCVCRRRNLRLSHLAPFVCVPVKKASKIAANGEEDPFLLDVFATHTIKGLPRLVNESLCAWFAGARSPILMFDMPSVAAVLRMMGRGLRVVTTLIQPIEALRNIYIDAYEPYERRCNLSFTIHDLQHLERFCDASFYAEQVGFFSVMGRHVLHANDLEAVDYTTHFSELCDGPSFAADVDHVLADMNACCLHMLQFLKAKWIAAFKRSLGIAPKDRLRAVHAATLNAHFIELFSKALANANITPENETLLHEAFERLCDVARFNEEAHYAAAIRETFSEAGRSVLQGQMPM